MYNEKKLFIYQDCYGNGMTPLDITLCLFWWKTLYKDSFLWYLIFGNIKKKKKELKGKLFLVKKKNSVYFLRLFFIKFFWKTILSYYKLIK